ncbi:hypothetical protein SHLI107390_08625 [Shewanella livingstonensis]
MSIYHLISNEKDNLASTYPIKYEPISTVLQVSFMHFLSKTSRRSNMQLPILIVSKSVI